MDDLLPGAIDVGVSVGIGVVVAVVVGGEAGGDIADGGGKEGQMIPWWMIYYRSRSVSGARSWSVSAVGWGAGVVGSVSAAGSWARSGSGLLSGTRSGTRSVTRSGQGRYC